jgi:hypothetical protein
MSTADARPHNNIRVVSAHIVIIGGGIAGLWLLNRLSNRGHDVVLLEKNALGYHQTLASQGIIHGGLKYALNGVLSPASSAIADMPARWRACLEGRGEIDLRDTRMLSEHYYMWSAGSVRSRLKTFLGSKALRGRIDSLVPADYPAFFTEGLASQTDTPRGTLYRLSDFVLDTPSLLQTLAQPWQDRVLHAADISIAADPHKNNNAACVHVQGRDGRIEISAAHIILCAGEGNEALLADWQTSEALNKPLMQRRPLHMVCVRVRHPAPAYLHCIGDSIGMTPRLTITSHPCHDGRQGEWIWYLGGELAESGVHLDGASQQTRAKAELTTLFPWVDFSSATWHSFMINRAEPRIADLQRPDNAFVSCCANLMVCWPTKLSLCPNLGDRVCEFLPDTLSGQRHAIQGPELATLLAPADHANPPWEIIR